MSPLKLIIPGRYWDSQIYCGRLHLFGMDGDILTLDWDELIDKLRIRDDLKLAARSAFQRSDFLYGVAATGILHDPEIKTIISHRFHDLSQVPLEPKQEELNRIAVGRQDNLFPFPHADSEIYNRRLYVSSRAGVFAANCGGSTKYPVSTRIARLSEMPVSAVRASYRSLALAAGEEGLWQYDLDDFRDGSRTERVASQHCSECQWAFHSIYGSSSTGAGVLASYLKRREPAEWTEREEWRRTLDRVIPDSEIFADFETTDGEYSWAAQDKICQAANGSIRVAKYEPWNEESPLRRLGVLPLARHGEAVVSARVALFGTVVELDSGLMVICSDEKTLDVCNEPVSWRVFPRSRHYENHLHVIHDDRLEVLSFNHDYLVDQRVKVSGISLGKRTSRAGYPEVPRSVASQRVAERGGEGCGSSSSTPNRGLWGLWGFWERHSEEVSEPLEGVGGARRMLTGSTTRSAHRWACGRADAPRFVGVPARIKIATGLQRKLLNRPAPTRCQRTLFNCIRITNHADATGGGRTHASPITASASWTMMCSTTP